MSRVRLLGPELVPEGEREFLETLHQNGLLINLYRAMAHQPGALRGFLEFASSLWHGSLSAREREIAILAVVSSAQAPYPLGWHLLDAKQAGLNDLEIQAALHGRPGILTETERAIAGFAREVGQAQVTMGTFDAASEFMDEKQIVELTMLAGLYRMVSSVANALDVEIDPAPAQALRKFGLVIDPDAHAGEVP